MSFEEEAKELVDELQSLMGEPHSRKHTADFTCGSLNAISSIITPGAIPVARPCPNTHCAEIRDRISKHMNNLASGQRISASLDANKIIIQLNSNYENGTNYPRQLIIDALSYVVNTQKNICE